MIRSKGRFILGFVILSSSLAVLLWGTWPAGERTRTVPIPPPEAFMKDPDPGSGSSPAREFEQTGRLVLSWPSSIRIGDVGVIRLTLEAEETGSSAQSNTLPVLYDTFNLAAEARLDLPGMDSAPIGDIIEPMAPGQPAQFFWSVQSRVEGDFTGTLWIYLRFIPHPDSAQGLPELRRILSAQRIELHTAHLLGLGGLPARVLGCTGALIGLVLILTTLWPRPGHRLK